MRDTAAAVSVGQWILFLLDGIRDDYGAGGIACDIYGGAAHVEDAVNARDQGYALDRQSDRLENHGEHDHSRAGHTGGTDGSQGSGEHYRQHLRESKADAEAGRDEYGAHALIDRGAVHVDGRAQRKDERRHLSVSSKLLGALHVHGKGSD